MNGALKVRRLRVRFTSEIASILLAAVLALLCFQASAFKVWFVGNAIHETITRISLNGIQRSLISQDLIGFTSSSISDIEHSNRNTDALGFFNSELHFDNEAFRDASARLVRQREEIVNLALSGRYLEARVLLGRTLHTIQDFYAHSTWIEAGNILPSAELGRSTMSVGFAAESDRNCSTPLGLPAASPLTSGYFTPSQINPSETIWTNEANNVEPLLLWPPYKCIHGSDGGPGLNKDQSGRGPNYQKAFNVAVSATAQFVNDVLGGVAIAGPSIMANASTPTAADAAICGLMGQRGSMALGCFAAIVTELPTVPGGDSSSPRGINDRGTVVGQVHLSAPPPVGTAVTTVWIDAVPSMLPMYALAINSRGAVAGKTGGLTDAGAAAIFENGSVSVLGTLGSEAYGMNDFNVAVGFGYPDSPANRVAQAPFLFRSSGLVRLENSGAVGFSAAQGINNSCQVVGTLSSAVPVIWNRGGSCLFFSNTRTNLQTVGGARGSANAINSWGHLVGYSDDAAGNTRATHWKPDNAAVNLGTISGRSVASGLNDSGIAVGNSGGVAVLWNLGVGSASIVDLNTLLGPADVSAGWRLLSASAINNEGWIVGFGTLRGRQTGFVLKILGTP